MLKRRTVLGALLFMAMVAVTGQSSRALDKNGGMIFWTRPVIDKLQASKINPTTYELKVISRLRVAPHDVFKHHDYSIDADKNGCFETKLTSTLPLPSDSETDQEFFKYVGPGTRTAFVTIWYHPTSNKYDTRTARDTKVIDLAY